MWYCEHELAQGIDSSGGMSEIFLLHLIFFPLSRTILDRRHLVAMDLVHEASFVDLLLTTSSGRYIFRSSSRDINKKRTHTSGSEFDKKTQYTDAGGSKR